MLVLLFSSFILPAQGHVSFPITLSLSPDKYICYGEHSQAVLSKLSAFGKKMFLITNSPFDFV